MKAHETAENITKHVRKTWGILAEILLVAKKLAHWPFDL
jgi:hypothetical protein